MFTLLNRLRGTYGVYAKINGLILSFLFYLYTTDLHTSLALGVCYVIGESFGWGKWIGGVYSKYELPATVEIISDKEGRRNGIHYLASLIVPETENYYLYCLTALSIRGFYWFSITLLPLVIGGYISIFLYLSLATLLGVGFPLSVELARLSEEKFSFSSKYLSVVGFWEHSEVAYGLMQDLAVIVVFLNLS